MTFLKPVLAACVLLGSAVGIGAYTFVYANGASYLSNNPDVCGNCHIMRDHLSAWTQGSHSNVATCNDCHTPPGSKVGKYATKASNGFRHSLLFTTGGFADPLRITDANTQVTERACRSCHTNMLTAIEPDAHAGPVDGRDAISCLRCHSRVGHWVR
jgi:cytochrome c nitrite reductase small subunit